MKNLDFENFENALNTLELALSKGSLNDLERDGAIQRYEYTFELAWKMMRKMLVALGRSDVSSSPKPVLRDALQEGFIDDINLWFSFLEARNLSTHIYSQEESEKVLDVSKKFLPCAKNLLGKLKTIK